MKKLVFIRHAESQANLQTDVIGGRANHVELTEKGIEQARILGRYMAEIGFMPSVVYRSPAVRTMQTTEHLMQTSGIDAEVYIHDGLQEMSQGVFEGRNRYEIYTQERIAAMNHVGKDAKLPGEGAESMTEVGDRMYDAALEIVDAIDDGETALVVGHGLAIRCFSSKIENWSREKTFETKTDNTSWTEIDYDGDFIVKCVGAMPHMNVTTR